MNEIELFNSIKSYDKYGSEYWYASNIFKLLEYNDWSNFKIVLYRIAKIFKNTDLEFDDHIKKIVNIDGKEDFKLSRFASYMLIINLNKTNKHVAYLSSYFVIQTIINEKKYKFI